MYINDENEFLKGGVNKKFFRSEVIAKKTVENTASDGVERNFSKTVQARMTKFYELLGDNLPHKFAEYNITSSFRSVAKCN